MSGSEEVDVSEFFEQLLGFNRKVKRLEQTRFFNGRPVGIGLDRAPMRILSLTHMTEEDGTPALEIEMQGEVKDFTLHHFNRDDIEAAVLTYRMLTQNNDRMSVARLGDSYRLAHTWFRTAFQSLRDQAKGLLAAESSFRPMGSTVSRQELLDTVIYGELAHSNKKKASMFNSWTQWPSHEKALWMVFDHTLRNAVEILRHFRDLNAVALMAHFSIPLADEIVFNRLQDKGIIKKDAIFSAPDELQPL